MRCDPMTILDMIDQIAARRMTLLARLETEIGGMQRRAPALDATASYPLVDMEMLHEIGVLAAPLPVSLGGLALGIEAGAALETMEMLRMLGSGNLSVARLVEAHLNAIRLIVQCGTRAQAAAMARDVLDGHVFGLWVTDAPDSPVTLDGRFVLRGAKMPCSGAGHATRALVTAKDPSSGIHMLLVQLDDCDRANLAGWHVHGMRAACNGRMTIDGLHAGPDTVIGMEGDYLRQPDFSAGAWRGSAVALGAIETLVMELRQQLARRGRDAEPHQAARVGHALIAQETARCWVRRAAIIGESATHDSDDIVGVVNLARLAVEKAGFEVIQIVQRSLGLGAFRSGTLVELLFRDLATYLRQPAPDEALTDAAAQFMRRSLPPLS